MFTKILFYFQIYQNSKQNKLKQNNNSECTKFPPNIFNQDIQNNNVANINQIQFKYSAQTQQMNLRPYQKKHKGASPEYDEFTLAFERTCTFPRVIDLNAPPPVLPMTGDKNKSTNLFDPIKTFSQSRLMPKSDIFSASKDTNSTLSRNTTATNAIFPNNNSSKSNIFTEMLKKKTDESNQNTFSHIKSSTSNITTSTPINPFAAMTNNSSNKIGTSNPFAIGTGSNTINSSTTSNKNIFDALKNSNTNSNILNLSNNSNVFSKSTNSTNVFASLNNNSNKNIFTNASNNNNSINKIFTPVAFSTSTNPNNIFTQSKPFIIQQVEYHPSSILNEKNKPIFQNIMKSIPGAAQYSFECEYLPPWKTEVGLLPFQDHSFCTKMKESFGPIIKENYKRRSKSVLQLQLEGSYIDDMNEQKVGQTFQRKIEKNKLNVQVKNIPIMRYRIATKDDKTPKYQKKQLKQDAFSTVSQKIYIQKACRQLNNLSVTNPEKAKVKVYQKIKSLNSDCDFRMLYMEVMLPVNSHHIKKIIAEQIQQQKQFKIKPNPEIVITKITSKEPWIVQCDITQRLINLDQGYRSSYQKIQDKFWITGLTICNEHGEIYWNQTINLKNIDFKKVLSINKNSISIYEDREFPPQKDTQLNREIIVTLNTCKPVEDMKKKVFSYGEIEIRLKQICKKKGAKFIDYDPQDNSWRFKVFPIGDYCEY